MIKKIVVLAAGKGTRMLEYSKNQPKHLINIGDKPFLYYSFKNLKEAGFSEIIVVIGYKKEVMEKFAKKYGKEFVELIENYVDENDITRPDDLIVKSTGVNSGLKLFIIQNTDKKLPLIDIAKSKGIEMDELIKVMEQIIYSGTKLNIGYCVDNLLDEDQQEEIHDYFLEDAETDDIETAMEEFEGEYEEEELRLYRIKFFSEVAN